MRARIGAIAVIPSSVPVKCARVLGQRQSPRLVGFSLRDRASARCSAPRDARREAIAAKPMHRLGSGTVRCVDAMAEEVDAVAELITGNARYFNDKG
jgi:hypothetical protein